MAMQSVTKLTERTQSDCKNANLGFGVLAKPKFDLLRQFIAVGGMLLPGWYVRPVSRSKTENLAIHGNEDLSFENYHPIIGWVSVWPHSSSSWIGHKYDIAPRGGQVVRIHVSRNRFQTPNLSWWSQVPLLLALETHLPPSKK